VSRRDGERLEDIVASAQAIASHLKRGDLADGLVFDAVLARGSSARRSRRLP
jgi:hypothetical protein